MVWLHTLPEKIIALINNEQEYYSALKEVPQIYDLDLAEGIVEAIKLSESIMQYEQKILYRLTESTHQTIPNGIAPPFEVSIKLKNYINLNNINN